MPIRKRLRGDPYTSHYHKHKS